MTREEFREIRLALGLTQAQWAQALGLSRGHAAKIEGGQQPLQPTVAALAEMYRRHGLMDSVPE